MKYLEYTGYILRHKYFVFTECVRLARKRRILHAIRLIWRGIKHDFSKFYPSEFFPYAERFNGAGKGIWDDNALPQEVRVAFYKAWLYHQRNNDHHWQSWLLRLDSGDLISLPMPAIVVDEMIADWRGAGKAIGKPDTKAWYLSNKNNIILNEQARQIVEKELGVETETHITSSIILDLDVEYTVFGTDSTTVQ